MSAEALERAAHFVAAQGSPFARLRLGVLLGDCHPEALTDALAGARSPDGALAMPDEPGPGGVLSTARALTVLEAGGRLEGMLVEDASAWLSRTQRDDGCWAEGADDDEQDGEEQRIVVTGTVAGLLARTLCARPSTLLRAASWLEAHASVERLQSGGPGLLAACAGAFTSLPSERADEILQWCGREIEHAFRRRSVSALATARALLACDAMALPGARLRPGEVLEALLAEQAPDGGFGDGPPAQRVEAALDATRALLRLAPGESEEARSVTRVSGHATRSEPKASVRQSGLNLALLHEAIAEAVPERECLVFRERRFTWAEVTERSRRLADVLRAHGLGCHVPRSRLAGHESGQDHVALYLYNGNEYLEGMLGAFKARSVPVNVNYRYVDDELLHLFTDSGARAVIFHAAFAPVLARLRDRLPGLRLWLQVEDGSGEPLLPGALDYEKALAEASPAAPAGLSPDDLYILYTGGTTGMPKGVLWRQEDIFLAALAPRGVPPDLASLVERAREGGPRVLPTPPFMHGAAHWVAFSMWFVGGSVVMQSETRRLDPHDVWSTAEREGVTALTIVGDAFGRPLLDALSERSYDLSKLRLLTSGGAILSAGLKEEFLRRLPGLRILDALGSSESGQQAHQISKAGTRATTGDFALVEDNVVLREDLSGEVPPGSGEMGWLARRGSVPLGYYEDPEKTARTFPVIRGVRYAVPGDRAVAEAGGGLRLLGRDSVTINTGGEKVFAEEVEHALKHHPSVYDAVVVGTPHPRFGQQVTAVVKLRGEARVDEEELRAALREHLAGYKIPRAFVFVDELVRAPSGKADYRWARARAAEALGGAASS